MTTTLASKSFYKRPLPTTCTPFNSTRGKQIFANSMKEGNLDSYFLLSQHFLTQNEPAYCALGTLAMILNSFEMDPQRVWKGPWRFYDQEMLDCCRPLSDIAQVGLTLSEFSCLARCNGLKARSVSPPLSLLPTTSTTISNQSQFEERRIALDRFRKDLKLATSTSSSSSQGTIMEKEQQNNTIMALSYSRKVLDQTGTGHFSPVGAFSEKDDMVLILDVARFKYPSYWISTELAYESMIPIDVATGQPRGYVMLQVNNTPLEKGKVGNVAGRTSLTTLNLNKSSWATLSTSISRLFLETPKDSTVSSLLERLGRFVETLPTSPVVVRPPPQKSIQLDDSSSPSSIEDKESPESTTPSLDDLFSKKGTIEKSRRLSSSSSSENLFSQLLLSYEPTTILFLLTLFSSRSPLKALIPPHLSSQLSNLLVQDSTTATISTIDSNSSREVLREEVEFLTSQLGALGECCRAEEEEGSRCGCVGNNKGK